jgi:hypothetical protein
MATRFEYMIDGVRIFDISSTGNPGARWRSDYPWAKGLTAFAGPAGSFFSDGKFLYSSDNEGFYRWDLDDGARTGYLQGFIPTHHHSGAYELVQLVDNDLVRWKINDR